MSCFTGNPQANTVHTSYNPNSPDTFNLVYQDNNNYTLPSGLFIGSSDNFITNPDNAAFCSGHGRCMTMQQAAAAFTTPKSHFPFIYNDWDANMMQGCVCDEGWTGPSCAFRTCTKGVDPIAPTTLSHEPNPNPYDIYSSESYFTPLSSSTEEEALFTSTERDLLSPSYGKNVHKLQCQADGGYFTFIINGKFSPPISYDADPDYLSYMLQNMEGVGKVFVSTPANSEGLPTLCTSASITTTDITFLSFPGSNSLLVGVSSLTYNGRVQAHGGTALFLNGGGTPVLQLATIYTLTCPTCTTCTGNIYFTYGDSLSSAVSVSSTSGISLVTNAIVSLLADLNTAFSKSVMGTPKGLTVSVTSTYSSLCSSAGVSTTTITLGGPYGNIGNLGVIDGSRVSSVSSSRPLSSMNLTWSSHLGSQGLAPECSSEGHCNVLTGTCECFTRLLSNGVFSYAFEASDGSGNSVSGSVNDCGYARVTPQHCPVNPSTNLMCSGHGVCNNATTTCSCFDGWSGVECTIARCPLGNAWFDAPLSSTSAHNLVECSNAGYCDRTSGICNCNAGFIGSACEIMDCPRDPQTGIACSGHGWCLSIAEIADSQGGYRYGGWFDPSGKDIKNFIPSEWDAHKVYQCVCSNAVLNSPYPHFKSAPTVGPSALISGISVGKTPMPGWFGYDCSQRSCPYGDNTDRRHSFQGAKQEIQRVLCIGTSSASFQLTLWGFPSKTITGGMSAKEIKDAIEWIRPVVNVSVLFSANLTDDDWGGGFGLGGKACTNLAGIDTSSAGFYVYFDQLTGPIPKFGVIANGATPVSVYEEQKGSSLNLECSGGDAGVCNRETQTCECSESYVSSDGIGNIGNKGDCGAVLDSLPHSRVYPYGFP